MEQQMACVCLSLAGQLLRTGPRPRQTCSLFNSRQRRGNSSKRFQVQQMPLGLTWKGAEVCVCERRREEGGATAELAMCLGGVSTKEDQEIRENSISSLARRGQSSWWLISRHLRSLKCCQEWRCACSVMFSQVAVLTEHLSVDWVYGCDIWAHRYIVPLILHEWHYIEVELWLDSD